jgi:hypothetical protein
VTEPPVDELVAQAELRRQASAQLPEILASTTGVATDRRRLVQATTDASGALLALAINPAAYSFGGREIGLMVIEAAQTATEFARQRCFNALALVLGDNATREIERMIGPAPARAAGWDTVPDAPAVSPETSPIPVVAVDDIDPDDPMSFDPSSLRSDR